MASRKRTIEREIRGLVIFLGGSALILLGVWTGAFTGAGALVGKWYVDFLLHR